MSRARCLAVLAKVSVLVPFDHARITRTATDLFPIADEAGRLNTSEAMHDHSKPALYLLGLLAAAVILIATSTFGIGVTAESRNTTRSRREIWLLGTASRSSPKLESLRCSRSTPRLYAALLGTFGRCGIDPIGAARWLSAALFGMTVLLVGLILKLLCSSVWLPPLGSLLTLLSVVLLNLHLTALSEPLFIVCQLACLYLLLRFLFTSEMRFLFCATAACALAVLTRYAGAALVAAGIAGLLLLDRNTSLHRRAAQAALFATLSCLPMLVWMAYSATQTGNPVDRTFGIHVPPPDFFLAGIGCPLHMDPSGSRAAGVPVACSDIGHCYVVRRFPAVCPHRPRRGITQAAYGIRRLFLFFGMAHIAVTTLSRSFVDVAIILDDRILSPLYAPALLSALLLAAPQFKFAASRPILATICAAALATVIAADAMRTVPSLVKMHHVGRGYTGAEWRHSTLLQWLREISPATPVYSNVDSAVRFFRGTAVPGLPSRFHTKSGRPDVLYDEKMKQLSINLHSPARRGGIFADAYSGSSPTEAELTSGLGLQVIAGDGDWRAMGFRESTAPTGQ